MATAKKTPAAKLPPDVLTDDCKYGGTPLPYDENKPRTLTFYHTEKFGWVLCTLHISNPSRRQAAGTTARSYGIGVADSKIYTVGKGPHVTAECTVCLNQENLPRLQRYVDLYLKGLGDAGQIRDRISSRRAQGQLYRNAGRSSWGW